MLLLLRLRRLLGLLVLRGLLLRRLVAGLRLLLVAARPALRLAVAGLHRRLLVLLGRLLVHRLLRLRLRLLVLGRLRLAVAGRHRRLLAVAGRHGGCWP